MIYGKKGGEKLLSIWWFAVLAITGGAIVVGVLMFSSADLEVRELESSILADRVLACLSDNGILNRDALNSDPNFKFKLSEACGLDEGILGSGLYIKANFSGSDGREIKKYSLGDASMEKDCSVAKTIQAVKYPKCTQRKEAVIIYHAGGRRENAVLE